MGGKRILESENKVRLEHDEHKEKEKLKPGPQNKNNLHLKFLGATTLDEFCKRTLIKLEELSHSFKGGGHKYIWFEGFYKLLPKKTEPEAIFMFSVHQNDFEWK